MSRFRRLFRLALGRRPDPREIDEELRLHRELRAAELEAEGLSPADARAEADRLFGDPKAYGRDCLETDRRRARSVRRADTLDGLRQDLTFAVRSFRRRPLFTAIALGTLALGVGAVTTVFSLVDGVLLRPLPYATPERLVFLRGAGLESSFAVSERERLLYRAETSLFEMFGTWVLDVATVGGPERSDRVRAAYVDAAVLPTLGIVPALGRGFTPEEDRPGQAVVVLSSDYWRRQLGGRRDALGRALTINGSPRVVVGVLPPAARLPDDFGAAPADLYLPLALGDTADPRNLHYLSAAARLAPALGLAGAAPRLDNLARRLAAELPTLPPGFWVDARPVAEAILGPVRPVVVLLFVAVLLLLLLASVNLAGLLLASAEARRREFAVRTALGAGQARLTRQVLTESLVLALVGGGLGVGAGLFVLRALPAFAPPGLPRANTVSLDARAVAFAVGVTLLTALGAGLIPALRVGRRGAKDAAGGAGRASSGSRDRHVARRGLVLAEVALAIAITVAAGLVVRSWVRLLRTDPGFVIERTLSFSVALPGAEYPEPDARRRFYRLAIDQLADLPGVVAAGGVSSLPLDQEAGDWGLRIEGRPPAPEGERNPYGDRFIVTDGYVEAMGIPLLNGRAFTPADDAGAAPVVILNEALARRYWPGGQALGARIRLSSQTVDSLWRTVVGIVGNVRSRGLDRDPRAEVFFPYAQFPAGTTSRPPLDMSLVLRAAADPVSLADQAGREVRSLDTGATVSRTRTLEDVLDSTLAARRFQLLLLSFFAVSGLALVAMGVYGVVAFLVQQRSAEFGIRMALGADRGRILRLVLRDGAVLGGAGALIGLAVALAGGRLIEGLLYQVSARDPLVLIGVPMLVLAVVLAATLSPALRAARTDPGTALHED